MKHGGFSPFFGWILDGEMVSEQDYRDAQDRADKYAEAGGKLWS